MAAWWRSSKSRWWVAIAKKQRGFFTPDEPPTTFVCRRLFIPDNLGFVSIVNGALSELAFSWNYQQQGTLTPEQTAEYMAQMLVDFMGQYGACEGGESEVPAPYWDAADDNDDELPAAEQIWYGNWVDGEFVENIGTWVIAGFLAYAGTPGAALTFLTLAPSFRLAWRTGNLGGIIRVIIDGADYGTVDTFSASPGVLEKDFVANPDEEWHNIVMVLE